MAVFRNNAAQVNVSERNLLEAKYTNLRHNLLFVVIFTVINAILLLANANSYFLFSAYIPYYLIFVGMLFCGKLPDEFYTEEFNGMEFMNDSFLIVMCVLAVIGIGLYLLCWFMSKKKVGWLIAALVLISVDTLVLFGLVGFSIDMLLDYLFHALVIYYLVSGIMTHNKLKKLPEEEAVVEVVDFEEAPVVEGAPAEIAEVAEAAPETAPETVEKAPETDVEQ